LGEGKCHERSTGSGSFFLRCQFYHLAASNLDIPEHFMVVDILFEILGIPFARNPNQISHSNGRYTFSTEELAEREFSIVSVQIYW
jgi:hypothetical protein